MALNLQFRGFGPKSLFFLDSARKILSDPPLKSQIRLIVDIFVPNLTCGDVFLTNISNVFHFSAGVLLIWQLEWLLAEPETLGWPNEYEKLEARGCM